MGPVQQPPDRTAGTRTTSGRPVGPCHRPGNGLLTWDRAPHHPQTRPLTNSATDGTPASPPPWGPTPPQRLARLGTLAALDHPLRVCIRLTSEAIPFAAKPRLPKCFSVSVLTDPRFRELGPQRQRQPACEGLLPWPEHRVIGARAAGTHHTNIQGLTCAFPCCRNFVLLRGGLPHVTVEPSGNSNVSSRSIVICIYLSSARAGVAHRCASGTRRAAAQGEKTGKGAPPLTRRRTL